MNEGLIFPVAGCVIDREPLALNLILELPSLQRAAALPYMVMSLNRAAITQ